MHYITQKEMRNHCFRRAFRQAREQRLDECVGRIVDRVLNTPVKRGFFVSVDHMLIMERKRRQGKLPTMGALRRQMWDEIFAAIDDYRRRHPRATITDAACSVASSATASRFFIAPSYARKLATSLD